MGKEYFSDCSFFEGSFSDGSKCYGTYVFKNGSKYNENFQITFFMEKVLIHGQIKKFMMEIGKMEK